MSDLIGKAGGRKFVQSMTGTGLVPLLAALHAPGEAYLALAGIVAAFVGGNTMVSRKALDAGVSDG